MIIRALKPYSIYCLMPTAILKSLLLFANIFATKGLYHFYDILFLHIWL